MTPRKDAREAGKRLAEEHDADDPFAAAFRATRMPMVITDPKQDDNPIIFCNRAFQDLSGYSAVELIGSNCRMLQGPDTDAGSVEKIRAAVEAEESISLDILNYRKDQSTFWNALLVSPVQNEAGELVYFFASQLDVTDIKGKEAETARARRLAIEEVAERTADLEEALQAKTLLVHEVDHRVKNNLLTIATILKQRMRMSTDSFVRETLNSILNRVEALCTVQRELFNGDDVGRFDVSEFTRELVVDVLGALKRDDIKLTLDLHPVFVPAAKASPIALIVNELVGDAVRRGLKAGGGEVHVEIRRLNGHFLINVVDTAMSVSVDAEEDAFGRLMLETSSRHVGAEIERNVSGDRTSIKVILAVTVRLAPPAA